MQQALSYIGSVIATLSGGLGQTLLLFALTILISLPLGLLVSLGRMSRFAAVRIPIKLYISIMRGTPLMLQLLFVYFGPFYIFGPQFAYGRFTAAVIAFGLNYAAYFAEIYRGGIQSMPRGQYEASAVLGFTRSQTFFRIILPQVIKNILPATTNEVITLVKDTSLAQVIAVVELFRVAETTSSAQASVYPLIIAGVFYYIMNYVVAWIMERAEKSLSYYSA